MICQLAVDDRVCSNILHTAETIKGEVRMRAFFCPKKQTQNFCYRKIEVSKTHQNTFRKRFRICQYFINLLISQYIITYVTKKEFEKELEETKSMNTNLKQELEH